jgi:UrcA family protein
MSNLSRTIGGFAICVTSFVSLSAMARSPLIVTAPQRASDVPSRHVSYADLNLFNHAGLRTLDLRIDAAIDGVCSDSGWQASEKGFADCRYNAWTGARPQVATAIQRAMEIATTGQSALPVVAIAIVAH